MIRHVYLFDATGRCVVKFSSQKIGPALQQEIDLQASCLPDPISYQPFVAAIDYKITDIYWERGRLRMREPLPATVDGTTISGLPTSYDVYLDGTINEVRNDWDGVLQLNFGYPGVYLVTISSWPYFDRTFQFRQS
jgi:hypothetical protein